MSIFNPWPVHHRVMVNLRDGSAIGGVLLRRVGALIVLADGVLHTPGQDGASMDGEVYIERAQIAFIQAMPPKGG
jgi:ABC-type iron transport system FetAB ATPase subunit